MAVQTQVLPAPNQPGQAVGIWSGPYRLLTIGLTLTVGAVAFEALAVATTLPATVKDLGGLALYGWAFSAFMLTNLIGVTVAGVEADRSGPARPFLAGVVLFMLGLLVAGLAPSMLVVIAGRAVQGLGGGLIASVAYVAIGRGYPEALRPQMIAVLSSAWVVPGLIGPALAGLVAEYVGWRWVFLGLAPLAPLAALLALPALRRLTRTSTATREWGQTLASLALAAGAGLALAGLGVAQPVVALALIVVGLLVTLPALRRLLPPGTLRAAPGLPAAIATHGLLNFGFFGVDAFVPLALTNVRGQSTIITGLVLTAATITWTTGSWVQARLAPRGHRRTLVLVGLGLIALGIVGVTAVLSPVVPVALAPVAWGVAGLGIGLSFSTISLVVLERATEGQEGAASAAMQLANQLGVAVGAGIGGALVGALANSDSAVSGPLAIQGALMVGVIALAALVARRIEG